MGRGKWHCRGHRGFQPERDIEINATMVIFDGLWPVLRQSRTPHAGVSDFGTALQHENDFHLNVAVATLLAEVSAKEQSQTTFGACTTRCTEISVFVNHEFVISMKQTQQVEEAGGDPP